MPREYPYQASAQLGLFTLDQARRTWTRSALDNAVRTGRLRRLRRGVYQVADLREIADLDVFEHERWQHAAAGAAAALATPGARASHSTAAILHGLPLMFIPPRGCVTVLPWYAGEMTGVHLHRCTRSDSDVQFGRIDAHGVGHSIVDLAREHGVAAAVVALDAALRRRLTSESEMRDELCAARGWPGVRAARCALDLADARGESPLESRSRLRLLEYDLPGAEPQVLIVDTDGAFVARPDFYWDECGVVGEVDGAVKYAGTDMNPVHREKLRQEAMERLGLQVVRWGSADLTDFGGTASRIARAQQRGARRGSPDRRWAVIRPTTSRFDPGMHAPARAERAFQGQRRGVGGGYQ